MPKSLSFLTRGECQLCHRFTRVREHYLPEAHKSAQVCARCVPVDEHDMVHESSKLVVAGY